MRAYQKIKSRFRLSEIPHFANYALFLKEQYALLMGADNGLVITLEDSRCFHSSTDFVAMWKRQIFLRHWSPASQIGRQTRQTRPADPAVAATLFRTKERTWAQIPFARRQLQATDLHESWKKAFFPLDVISFSSLPCPLSRSLVIRNFWFWPTAMRIWIWTTIITCGNNLKNRDKKAKILTIQENYIKNAWN